MIDLDPKHKEVFEVISRVAAQIGQPVYVVGGYVRDYYLNRLGTKPPDVDFVTVGSGVALAEAVATELGVTNMTVFRQFGTAHMHWHGLDLEFVGARRESYNRDSRNPVVEDGTLEDDQRRRDFTINALSWSLNLSDYGQLIDPFNGIRDLRDGIIRTPLEPEVTFSDDPLRMMRAVRFATQLGFTIEERTLAGISAMHARLEIISTERIADELNKIILAPQPSSGFALLFETGLLNVFFPEMVQLHGVREVNGVRHKDNFWHTLEVLDNVARVSEDLWLRWSAILHDIAKPPTQRFSPEVGWTFHGHDALGAKWAKRIFQRLGLPLDERLRYVQKLVRLHLRPIALVNEVVTDSAIRRLLFEAGADIDDLMTLCRADITSKNDTKVKKFLRNFDYVADRMKVVEEKDRMRNWQPPVGGEVIMAHLSLKAGPDVGRIKSAIENAILDGVIPNDYDAAIAYMYQIRDSVLGVSAANSAEMPSVDTSAEMPSADTSAEMPSADTSAET